jgi:hypothetical protein
MTFACFDVGNVKIYSTRMNLSIMIAKARFKNGNK